MTNPIAVRDEYLIGQALVYASEFLASLPVLHDEVSNRLDMDDLLDATWDPSFIEQHRRLAQEKLAAVNLMRRSDNTTE